MDAIVTSHIEIAEHVPYWPLFRWLKFFAGPYFAGPYFAKVEFWVSSIMASFFAASFPKNKF